MGIKILKIMKPELKIFLNEEPKSQSLNKMNFYMGKLLVILPSLIKNAKYLDMSKIKL